MGRLCGDSTETVWHIVSGCRKLHNKVAPRVRWELCSKYELEFTDKWYVHQPLLVANNGEDRITWDITIYTNKRLKCNQPDITVVHKDTQECTLIATADCQMIKIS